MANKGQKLTDQEFMQTGRGTVLMGDFHVETITPGQAASREHLTPSGCPPLDSFRVAHQIQPASVSGQA